MRQRITFIQEPQDSLDPQRLQIGKNSIATQDLKAAREDRITLSLDELPQELYQYLQVSTFSGILKGVATARRTSHTPALLRADLYSGLLCPTLKTIFGDLDCISPEQSFTTLPNDRFSHSSPYAFFQPLESVEYLHEYIKHKFCQEVHSDCLERVVALLAASSVDIDFDTISHALIITAFSPPQSRSISLSNKIPKDRMEVGILSVESPKEPEELSLGGFLTVVGEDAKASPTLFSFPARHHPVSAVFSASFLYPTGLHPTLELKISSSAPPTDERTCSLHTHLTLPRSIFADRYQLSDPLFIASKNISALHHITNTVDLEAPTYTLNVWGSSLLLELAPPSTPSSFTAQIPLHLRYLPPTPSGKSKLKIPYPVVFWACVADEGSKFPINPFDRVNIGYDGLFGPKTMFYHLSPGVETLFIEVSVPVLESDKSDYVESGTAGVVVLGFMWVLWCLFRVWRRHGYGSSGVAVVDNKKKL
ncbi:pbn1 [Hyphodiscus hymeniophilus]|uniref:Protein PBN1 n=1 Tax=Hyphodiscus hymeniophilus TaxID=353542 RepID=A0A9P7B0P3_9HELO|nr:pbn1 [Hyphodiscus hymeniophilus]